LTSYIDPKLSVYERAMWTLYFAEGALISSVKMSSVRTLAMARSSGSATGSRSRPGGGLRIFLHKMCRLSHSSPKDNPFACGSNTMLKWHLNICGSARFCLDLRKMRRISLKNCPYCGYSEIYISSSTSLWPRISVLFLLRLVRCHVCMRRHYRPIFMPTAKHLVPSGCAIFNRNAKGSHRTDSLSPLKSTSKPLAT
jgi:hypothetical protein